jgi:vancomycin resistance protein VanJ
MAPMLFRGRRPARLAASAYAGLLLATLALRRSRLAHNTPLSVAIDLLAPGFLPLPLALVLAAMQRDAGVLAPLVLPAAAFARLYGRRFVPRHTPRNPPWSLSLLTVNLLMNADNAEAVAQQVLEANPDLFAAQELRPRVAAGLQKRLGGRYPHQVLEPHAISYGLGWWSRLPLRSLGMVHAVQGHGVALAVEAQGPAGPLRLVNAHPYAPYLGPREAGWRLYDGRRRDHDLEAIVAAARALAPPLVVVGDFNLTEHSAAYAQLIGRLHDSFAEAGRGFGHTFPARHRLGRFTIPWRWPFLRLDYCFLSPDLEPLEATVLGRNGSDHLPLLVRFGPATRS